MDVVHRQDGALDETNVVLLGAYRAQKPGDVSGVEARGGHLIKQWLERVVGMPVDQSDVDISVLEFAYRSDTAESAADHDDMRTL